MMSLKCAFAWIRVSYIEQEDEPQEQVVIEMTPSINNVSAEALKATSKSLRELADKIDAKTQDKPERSFCGAV